MALVKFIQTTDNMLSTIPIKEGQLIFCTDSQTIYVDQLIDSVATRIKYGSDSDNFVEKTGDTMTGALNVNADGGSLKLSDADVKSTSAPFEIKSYAGQYIVITFSGDGQNSVFALPMEADVSEGCQVSVNYEPLSDGYTLSKTGLEFDNLHIPETGAYIEIGYTVASNSTVGPFSESNQSAYTFGTRSDGEKVGAGSFVSGIQAAASGKLSHAEGLNTSASGDCSHAEGQYSVASGHSSHAEGINSAASGGASHAEGAFTTASGAYSHSEGNSTIASGQYSHAEGGSTEAIGHYGHAEGFRSIARGDASHAEGSMSEANGQYSHSEGHRSTASGQYSHAQNYGTVAQRRSQTALGEYNVADTQGARLSDRGKYAVIVGNGTDNSNRSNALTVDWEGNVEAHNLATREPSSTSAAVIDCFPEGTPPQRVRIKVADSEGHTYYAILADDRIALYNATSASPGDEWRLYTKPQQLTITRIENEVMNVAAVNNLSAYEISGMLWFNGYIQITSPSMISQAGLEIPVAQISGWNAVDGCYGNIAMQDGQGHMLVYVNKTGQVRLHNSSGVTVGGYGRITLCAPKAY